MKRHIAAVAIGMSFLVVACSDRGSQLSPDLSENCDEGMVREAGQCVPVEQLPACPTGQVRNAEGVCEACPAGQVRNAEGACAACPAGQVVNAEGACAACPAGQVVNAEGACAACPAGQVVNAEGACAACPAGQVIDAEGVCAACPAGQVFAEGACVVEEQFCAFSDPNLAAAVRRALSLPADADISRASCAALTALDASSTATAPAAEKIASLAGLEQCTSIRTLNLSNNSIRDLTALRGLVSLAELNVSKNSISNISALVHLLRLVTLNLASNNVGSILPLCALHTNGGLPALSPVDVRFNPVATWSIAAELNCGNSLVAAGVRLAPRP